VVVRVGPIHSNTGEKKKNRNHSERHESMVPQAMTVSRFPSKKAQDLVILFERYSSLGDDINLIEMQGMISLLNDLDLTPMDLALLVIGFHLKANIIGVFTKEQFVNGFIKLNLSSIEEIKGNIPLFRQFAKDSKNLKDLYRYSLQFYREKPTHKTIPIDTAVHVLSTLLPPTTCKLLNPFRDFLLKQTEYKAINLDQWMNIYDFLLTVSENEMNDYSEISSWPYIIDMFVDWWKDMKNCEEDERGGGGKQSLPLPQTEEKDESDILMNGKFYKM
jgi:hypothetical protein